MAAAVDLLEDRTLLDGTPLAVVATMPTDVRNTTFDHIDIDFNQAINADTFTPADVTITGPADSPPVSVTGVSPIDADTFRVEFEPLSVSGTYTASIGPDIADLDGNLLDQNQNGTPGETGDVYSASLNYINASVIITTSMTISETNMSFEGQDILIDGVTVAIDGPHHFRSLQLVNGAVLTHTANTATETHKLDLTIDAQLIVDASSRIDVSGKGYVGGRTTGNTTLGGATEVAGGSYGGLGGNARGQGVPNAVYGDYADPDDWGSSSGDNLSVAGGGLVRLQAGILQLDGQLLANGADSLTSGNSSGSGGGILVVAQELTGTGLIRAGGGNSANHSGGGGGRVAVYAADSAGFMLANITATGGTSITGGAGSAGGIGTVHIAHGVYGTHVRSYSPVGLNGGFVGEIGSVVMSFNKAIDESSFSASTFRITGQMGLVVPVSVSLVGDRAYRIDFPTLSQSGVYHFNILPTLLDIEGLPFDQNANGVGGEPEDGFAFDLFVDTVAPRASQHSPAGDLAGTVASIDIWFSEDIDNSTFTTADVSIIRPDAQQISATGIQEVGFNRFRISFAPQTLTGPYQVLIGPDVRDLAGNRLDQDRDGVQGEATDDVYDAAFNLVPVDLQLNDLVLSTAQLVAGDSISVSWIGRNATGAPLQGNWIDAVYLSSDDHWDIGDTLLATVPHTGGLAQDETYSQSVNVVVPGKLPGNYRILVRADVANQERETNEADNVIAGNLLPLTVRALPTDGATVHGTLTTTDRGDYYAITLGSGESLDLVLNGLAATGINELYVRRNAIPTRQDYDVRLLKDEFDVDGQDHRIALTAPPDGGVYYVLVYGEQVGDGSPYAISARTAPVLVTGITPSRHGNGQAATVTLSGAGFDDFTTVEFIGSDGSIFTPTTISLVSSAALTLELDLPNWSPDSYRVRVVKDAASDEMPEPFVVTQGGAARLETNLIVPSVVSFRPRTPETVWIEYRNTGDIAMPAPLLQLTVNQGAKISADPILVFPFQGFDTAPAAITGTLQVLALGSSSTPWLLQPGEVGRVRVYYLGREIHGDLQVTFSLGTLTADDLRPIDWNNQEARIRQDGLTDAEWSPMFQAIRSGVGEVWGGYVTALGSQFKPGGTESARPNSIAAVWSGFAAAAVNFLPTWLVQTFTDYARRPDEVNYGDIPLLENPPHPMYFSCRDSFNTVWADVSIQDTAFEIVRSKEERLERTIYDAGVAWLGRVSKIAFELASSLNAVTRLRSSLSRVKAALNTPAPELTPDKLSQLTQFADGLTGALFDYDSIKEKFTQVRGTDSAESADSLLQEIVDVLTDGTNLFTIVWRTVDALTQWFDLVDGLEDAVGALGGIGYVLGGDFGNDLQKMVDAASRVFDDSLAFTLAVQDYEAKVQVAKVHLDRYLDCREGGGGEGGGGEGGGGEGGGGEGGGGEGGGGEGGGGEGGGGEGGGGEGGGGEGGGGEGGGGGGVGGGTPGMLNPPFNRGGLGNSTAVGSFDPNDKLSPAGFGDPAFVQADGSLAYTVRFENKSDATAPAQEIVVTDTLDADFDLDTFELIEIAFADQTISVPAGLSDYSTAVSITANGVDLVVEVSADLDRATRQFTLTLRAIDPNTGWFPENPLVGLLYPNDETGRGEGSISYLVAPKAGLPSGAEITNRASIVFDFNDPILTPLVLNTLDAAAPVSQITTAGMTTEETEIELNWTGEDDANGSGIARYDVFVSTDGNPYQLLYDDVTFLAGTFIGQTGHTYAFYTVATDNVGHVELPPLTPDAVITILSPLVVDAGADQSAAEGATVGLTGATFTYSGDVGTLSGTIDWGDGQSEAAAFVPDSGGGTFANTHAYADDGNYTVTLTVSDNTGTQVQDTLQVAVANVAPTATLTNGGAVEEGSTGLVSFVGQFDPSTTDTTAGFRYSYDFNNDGVFEFTDIVDTSVIVPAAYLADGPAALTIRARITDKDGDFTYYTTEIGVVNAAPVIAASPPQSVNEGAGYHLDVSFADVGAADTHTATIDWGDGSPLETVIVIAAAGGGQISGSHTYADNGNYQVIVAVTDDDSAIGTASFIVSAANIAPTAGLSNGGAVDEGENGLVSFAGQFDPSAADTAAGFVYSYDFDNDGIFELSGVVAASVVVPGTFLTGVTIRTVRGRIADKDGDFTDYTTEITVNSVNDMAPVITALSNSAAHIGGAAEGKPVNVSARFIPAGLPASHTAVIDWGDGSTSIGSISHAAGTSQISGNHRYTVGGVYTITVKVTDGDGDVASETMTAYVTGAGVHNGVLHVVGTASANGVLISRLGSSRIIVASDVLPGLALLRTFNAGQVQSLLVVVGDGHDVVIVAPDIKVPAVVIGGSGNDALTGGGGPSVLAGGDGNDVLLGGGGRDIVIGGEGADVLTGDGGDDLLIAGRTAFDTDHDALRRLLAEWTSSRAFGDRVKNLSGLGTADRLNGNVFLITGTTVFDDLHDDHLFGGGGNNWYIFDAKRDRKWS